MKSKNLPIQKLNDKVAKILRVRTTIASKYYNKLCLLPRNKNEEKILLLLLRTRVRVRGLKIFGIFDNPQEISSTWMWFEENSLEIVGETVGETVFEVVSPETEASYCKRE